MSESVQYVLEIKPSIQAPGGKLERSGGCTQDCPHCVFSENKRVEEVRSVSDATLELLRLTQLAIKQACLGNNDTFNTLNITAGYPSLDQASLFERGQFLHGFTPQHLSFGFGDLSRIPLADLQDKDLADRLAAYVPFRFEGKPSLHVDCRVPLIGLSVTEESFEKAIALGRTLLQGTLSSTYAFNPYVLIYSESINAYPHPADLADPEKVEARFQQIQDYMTRLFPDNPFGVDSIARPEPDSRIFTLRHVAQHPTGVFVYANRIIPRKEASYPPPLTGLTPDSISISFFPDFVWINHSTYTVRDTTVRFTYKEYFEILKKSKGQGRTLKELLETAVLARRAQSTEAKPM